MKSPSPAFQFYPKDWLSDGQVREMTHEQKGVYVDLLSILWIEDGLPSDPARLARLVGVPRRKFERLWPGIASCFVAGALPGTLEQPRLFKEKLKQLAYKELQALKGHKGGKSKGINKTKKPRLQAGLHPAKAESKPEPSIAVRSSQFAVSVPVPTATEEQQRTSEPVVSALPDSAQPNGNGAGKATSTALAKPSPPWSKEAAIDWDARFGLGSCNPGRIGKALSPLVKIHGWDRVRPAWVRYLREKEPEFITPQDFASKFGVWSGDAAPAQGKQTKGQELAAMAARFIARGEP